MARLVEDGPRRRRTPVALVVALTTIAACSVVVMTWSSRPEARSQAPGEARSIYLQGGLGAAPVAGAETGTGVAGRSGGGGRAVDGTAASASGDATALAGFRGRGPGRDGGDGLHGHGLVRDARGSRTFDVRGASLTSAFGRNAQGQVVGGYIDRHDRIHGFVRSGGRTRTIDFPGAEGTFVSRINDRGQMVGSYTDRSGTPLTQAEHGFVLDGRRFRRIDVDGATETRPYGINDHGDVTGEYVDRAGVLHGFVRRAEGTTTTFDAPGAQATAASDIDSEGRIVGTSFDGQRILGFVREPDGTFTPLDHPDGSYLTSGQGINDQGQLAGYFIDARLVSYGWVYEDGEFTTVDAPPGNTLVLDIDDRGNLAGLTQMLTWGYERDRRGRITAVDAPGATSLTTLAGTNDNGEVVGWFDPVKPSEYQGFRRDRQGRFHPIVAPGGGPTIANDIDEDGRIVGSFADPGDNFFEPDPTSGFLLEDGRFTTFKVSGALQTNPTGMNDRGDVVGLYAGDDGVPHGFRRDRGGRITKIDVPDALATFAYDIDDQGRIVGITTDADGRILGFVRDRDGRYQTYAVPGTGVAQTRFYAINDRREIAVDVVDTELRHHGYVFDLDRERFTEVRPPGVPTGSVVVDIDSRGNLVGNIL